MDRSISSWKYIGLWRKEEIISDDDFGVFVILGQDISDPQNNLYIINGKGLDNLGPFEVNGKLNENRDALMLNKKYLPDARADVLRNIRIDAKKIQDYFAGQWEGTRIDGSRITGQISLRDLSALRSIRYFEDQNPEMELLKAHATLLEKRIIELRKEFPFAPPV